MALFHKVLKSKQLSNYISFLKKLKSVGTDFLVKGDMWIPSIKEIPGVHVGRDPMLSEYYELSESKYIKYTCSHLKETLRELDNIKGRKTYIAFEMTETELSIYVNNDQFVIASKYVEETDDFCPRYDYFNSIISAFSSWHSFNNNTLQALLDSHPVTITGVIEETGETTAIRLSKRLMKLRGDQCRKLDHSGEYVISSKTDFDFDDSVCRLIMHFKYQNIECVNIYHLRKYNKIDEGE